MKSFRSVLFYFIAGLFALSTAQFLCGQPAERTISPKQEHHSKAAQQHTEFVGVRTVRQLLHKTVEARTGDTIGKVNDVVINPRTGRIVFVVISSGGFAGVGAKLRPVPPGVLSQGAKRGVLSVDISPKRWKSAPRMSKERLANLENDSVSQKIYSFFHQPWPVSDAVSDAKGSPVNQLALASQLIGESVITRHHGEVGRITDLAMDLRDPRMAQVIILSTGADGNTFTVPITDFEMDGSGNALLLNTDAQSVRQLRAEKARSTSGKMVENSSPVPIALKKTEDPRPSISIFNAIHFIP